VAVKVGAVVQARMSSRRLPGKVLMPLAGRPVLAWLLERLGHASSLDAVVLATSDATEDDPVASFASENGVLCHRGPLDDVVERVLGAARAHGLDAIARVNGDSPLLDQRLLDQGVELFRAAGVDLVTNVRPRTFPPGQSVEVVRCDALERAHAADTSPEEREHVTGPLYGGDFRIARFETEPPRTEPGFTIDTPADHDFLEEVLRSLDRPHHELGWEELWKVARRLRPG
jgi:spore coat polysaccharide biosynthesis protein SpsF (cytidylyltransferase family)